MDLPDSQRIYEECRRDLLARNLSNSQSLDKAILSLSSGALALSVTFLSQIHHIRTTWALKISWVLFALSILCTLVSFLVSQLAINKQLEYAEKYYLDGKPEYLMMPNCAAKFTAVLNWLSAGLFILAVSFTLVFAFTNVGENMDDKKNINEGMEIPALQRIPDRRGAEVTPMQKVPAQPVQPPVTQAPPQQQAPSNNPSSKQTDKN